MTVDQLLEALTRRRITLFLKDGRLRFRAPAGALTLDLRNQITLLRQTLIERLHQEPQDGSAGVVRRCKVCKPGDWADESPTSNPIRTICRKCGRFIGYRPSKH